MKTKTLVIILLIMVCMSFIAAGIVFMFYNFGYFGCEMASEYGNLIDVKGKTKGHFIFPTEVDGNKITYLFYTAFGDFGNPQDRVTAITIPDGITEVINAIYEVENLKELYIGKDVEKFYPYYLYSAKLENIWVDPDNPYYHIENGCLIESKTNKLRLAPNYATPPDGITWIDCYSFCGRSMNEDFIIPSTVKYIGECAFSRCKGLKNLYIPRSVIGINGDAFLLVPVDVNFWFEIEIDENEKWYERYVSQFGEERVHFGAKMP